MAFQSCPVTHLGMKWLEIDGRDNDASSPANTDILNENEGVVARVESFGNANSFVLVAVGEHDFVIEGHPLARDYRAEYMRFCDCGGKP
jgi:hypothetical protein